jgi:serine/threonine-protein kinase
MVDDPRIRQLLEEILGSQATPEVVCASCPELLPALRERWQRVCRVHADLEALFPPADRPTPWPAEVPGPPRIPGYEVEGLLGKGGMGVVYRARHLALKRTVALKMLAAGPGHFAGRERFLAEAEAVARLQHPNIVQIHEVGEADGQPFLALEFVAGGSLAQRLAGQPLPPREAARLVAALAEAMHLAHSRNLVHRDLKPGNVLLAGGPDTPVGQCQPKITDFGVARQLDADSGHTLVGDVVGTPSYMAPEQAEGRAHAAGPAADVWALGAILYECLTGRPPFEGTTAQTTLDQVRHHEPAAPAALNCQVPRDLNTICLKCLRKPPEQRYSSARELADDLGRFVRGEPVAARPVGVFERARKWVRRRPTAAALVAAVALLAAAGGAAGWLLYRQEAHQAQTDREVEDVLARARGRLEAAWQAADVAALTEAAAEGSRAEDIARSGGADPAAWQHVKAFQEDAALRLARAHKNRLLREALLDVPLPREHRANLPYHAVPEQLVGGTSLEALYTAAFRRWGLDVDGTPEEEVVRRLGAEPAPVVQDVIAALDHWMLHRRLHGHPEAAWGRLHRLADRLDHDPRHRQLRALLVRVAPRPGAGLAALPRWELERQCARRELLELRRSIDPRTAPVLTVLLLARAFDLVGDSVGAERLLREAVTARPDQVALLIALGVVLEAQGPAPLADAIGYYRAARAQRRELGLALADALLTAGRPAEAEELLLELARHKPGHPLIMYFHGLALYLQGKPGAVEALRQVIDLQPDFAMAHLNLGIILANRGDMTAAEAALRKAVELAPNSSTAHHNLGRVLHWLGDEAAAEAALRRAIAIDPAFAEAYHHLGMVLHRQGDLADAAAALRRAIDLQPTSAESHFNLGNVLLAQRKPAEAEAAFRAALALKPDLPKAHFSLGNALLAQGKLAAAEAAFRRAVELQTDFVAAHHDLGNVLLMQAKYAAAEAAFREVLVRQPDSADAHRALGYALLRQQQPEAAEAALRRALALKPGLAVAWFNLGDALLEQGRFAEAGDVFHQAAPLFPAKHPGRDRSRQLELLCRRYAALGARLPEYVFGDRPPADAAELADLARLCHFKGYYATAARWYAEAFARRPSLAADPRTALRYHAACAAAPVGCGAGIDSAALGETERVCWRQQALEWLRADLAAWARWLDGDPAARRQTVRQALSHWRQDGRLGCMRDPAALRRLAAEERRDGRALWAEVDAVLARTEQ